MKGIVTTGYPIRIPEHQLKPAITLPETNISSLWKWWVFQVRNLQKFQRAP